VVVKVKSYNIYGWSIDSQPSTGGAKIQTEPIKMTVPRYMPLISTTTTINLEIDEYLANTKSGGYPVDSYQFLMSVDGGSVWQSKQGSDSNKSLLLKILVDQLNPGQSLQFKV